MKKFVLLVSVVVFMACSSNDDTPEECFIYEARIESECGNSDTRVTYSISEEEYNRLKELLESTQGDPCPEFSIETENNGQVTGFLRGVGKASC